MCVNSSGTNEHIGDARRSRRFAAPCFLLFHAPVPANLPTPFECLLCSILAGFASCSSEAIVSVCLSLYDRLTFPHSGGDEDVYGALRARSGHATCPLRTRNVNCAWPSQPNGSFPARIPANRRSRRHAFLEWFTPGLGWPKSHLLVECQLAQMAGRALCTLRVVVRAHALGMHLSLTNLHPLTCIIAWSSLVRCADVPLDAGAARVHEPSRVHGEEPTQPMARELNDPFPFTFCKHQSAAFACFAVLSRAGDDLCADGAARAGSSLALDGGTHAARNLKFAHVHVSLNPRIDPAIAITCSNALCRAHANSHSRALLHLSKCARTAGVFALLEQFERLEAISGHSHFTGFTSAEN
eukprot:1068166-Pleurochrysis_carterae.AAC.1